MIKSALVSDCDSDVRKIDEVINRMTSVEEEHKVIENSSDISID